MRIIIDIVHPADALFFKRPIETFAARGDDVRIVSRHKDVTCELLDRFGFPHNPVSRACSGTAALARELLIRDWAIFRAARSFRPNVMLGFGGISISHVGKICGIPSVAFYDSETAKLQTRLTYPFLTHLCVPESYGGSVPQGRTTRLPGTKDLSYLHPSAFTPDRNIATKSGCDNSQDNFFVRTVTWRANHDLGKNGWSQKKLRELVASLSKRGKVHLSSESPLPEDLKTFQYQGDPTDVHHVIAHCRLLIGESATMAAEAAILGVPAVYSGHDFPGYTKELADAGLIRIIANDDWSALTASQADLLEKPSEFFRRLRDDYVADCPDWAEAVVEAASAHAQI